MTGGVSVGPAPDTFPPTLREVMLRGRWLGMLVLCLVVAGVFAWLGQWQLGRALAIAPETPGSTEVVRPIADVVVPGRYLDAPLVGQKVSVSGVWVPGDFLVVSSRSNAGRTGFWVTGQLRVADASTRTTQKTSLAVALGWAATRSQADAAATSLDAKAAASPTEVRLTGRLISDEGPQPPPAGARPQEMVAMSPAALLSQWHDIDDLAVYRPFLTSATPSAGLTAIASPAPSDGPGVNWLNIFYAVEWAVFAGFAFYLWYRLAKDAWEKELEEWHDDLQPDAAR